MPATKPAKSVSESPTMTLSRRITRLSHAERGRLLAMLCGTIPQTVSDTLDRMEGQREAASTPAQSPKRRPRLRQSHCQNCSHDMTGSDTPAPVAGVYCSTECRDAYEGTTPAQSPETGQQILVDAPGPHQVLLVVSDGQQHAAVPIDRAHGRGGWDEVIRKVLEDLDGALAVERELTGRGQA